MPRLIYSPILITLSMVLLQVAGCATMKLPRFDTGKHIKASAKNPVSQIVCVWQPAEGRGLDELPGRGFAGQIVFLTGNSPSPVEVEGDVTIYLFDDGGTPEERSRPLHEFRFVDGSWQTHLIPTTWGPTYQLFIPYVRKGSHRASCSLAVKIETPEGRRVTSDMANIALRGSESVGAGAVSRYAPEHIRFPVGRVHTGSPAVVGGRPQVMPASGQLPLTAGAPATGHQTPRFESFSIPYDSQQTGDL